MTENLIPTSDPHVFIEEHREGYVRYCNDEDKRWEIFGTCDRRGDCLIGAVLPDGTTIRDHEHLAELGDRPDSLLDVPVTPEFRDCCPLKGRWL